MDVAALLPMLLSAARDPASLLLSVALISLAVLAKLLRRSIRRYRDEIRDRINECEDAHLERDIIQIGAIQLIAELLTILKGVDGMHMQAADFSRRSDELTSKIRKLNDNMLQKREDARKARGG